MHLKLLKKILGDVDTENQSADNLRVAMYHSSLGKGDKLKNIIFQNLSKLPQESPLKIVLATIALGMGADIRHVSQVIHIGPPRNMEAYIQQLGRAGRSGDQCNAVLYFNNSDVGRPWLMKGVKEYCINDKKCRRIFINSYFGFESRNEDIKDTCCDVCNPDLTCAWQFVQLLNVDKKGGLRKAIDMYVQSLELQSSIPEFHVEQLVHNVALYVEASYIVRDFGFDNTIADALSSIIRQALDGLTDLHI